MRAAAFIVLMVMGFCAACSPYPTPTPSPPAALWSPPVVVAQAAQRDAPALWVRDEVVAAWTGADDAGVHQDVRRFVDGMPGTIVVLPLPPTHPYARRSAPAQAGNMHLLWLDESADGTNRLFSAVLAPDLSVYRGATPVSDAPTLHYSIAPALDGSVWTAWSGGLIAEPAVTIQQIDADGRPLVPQRAAENAIYPALVSADTGVVFLFWLDGDTGELVRARVEGGEVLDARAVTAGVRLERGDRLVGLHAALDATHAYALWNVSRADGGNETWMAHGVLSAAAWAQPQPLALPDGTALAWGVPLGGQHDPLPVIVQNGDELGMVYLRGGQLTGYETITPLSAGLLGEPGLYADRNGRLVAAWSAPTTAGYAELKISTQRR